MPQTQSYPTVTDQFCGAGGSSQGAKQALEEIGVGEEGIKLALNHWSLAIETHNTNFPKTLHDCTDISASDPRRYPPTDILITSPECTNHSLAKGKKIVKAQMDLFASGKVDAAAERSRATMWDVPRFAEYHKYKVILVENVVDARKWVMFDSWLMAMHSLGYKHRCVYMNSQHAHPTPQSRDRMYVVFWLKHLKEPDLDFMPLAYCPKCGKDILAVQSWKNPKIRFGKYRQQYVYCCPHDSTVVEPYYHAAFNCIDWSDPGTRIGDRKKELSENTIRRIEFGLKKYGKEPYIFHAAYGKEARGVVRSTLDPSFTQTTVATQAIIVNDQHSTGIDCRVKSVAEQLSSIPTNPHFKLVSPPFIIKLEHSQRSNNVKPATDPMATQNTRHSSMLISNVRSTTDPLQTQTTTQGMGFVTISRGKSNTQQLTDPLNTVSAGGIHSGIVTNEAFKSFIHYNYGQDTLSHITQPLGSCVTKDRHSIISYDEPKLEDCLYRMLKPREIKVAMAFDNGYVILGNSRDQVKQLGNAVTPPAMKWLMSQVLKILM
jgi:DNA (cytosine-5)-methyltransferase 1